MCCRETRGLIEAAYKQVTRRVHRWRASLRRRRGDVHRETPPGGWFVHDAGSDLGTQHVRHAQPAPTERRPPVINAASMRPPTTKGHPQGSRGPQPAASARPPPTTGHPQGSRVEGVAPSTPRGRAPRHNAGWLAGPRRGITPWDTSGSPRATGADGAAPSRDQCDLDEAAYN